MPKCPFGLSPSLPKKGTYLPLRMGLLLVLRWVGHQPTHLLCKQNKQKFELEVNASVYFFIIISNFFAYAFTSTIAAKAKRGHCLKACMYVVALLEGFFWLRFRVQQFCLS